MPVRRPVKPKLAKVGAGRGTVLFPLYGQYLERKYGTQLGAST
jgi:hypothetical protein